MGDESMKCEYVCVCITLYILYLSLFLSINKHCIWYGVDM